jgi:hypothetical protein
MWYISMCMYIYIYGCLGSPILHHQLWCLGLTMIVDVEYTIPSILPVERLCQCRDIYIYRSKVRTYVVQKRNRTSLQRIQDETRKRRLVSLGNMFSVFYDWLLPFSFIQLRWIPRFRLGKGKSKEQKIPRDQNTIKFSILFRSFSFLFSSCLFILILISISVKGFHIRISTSTQLQALDSKRSAQAPHLHLGRFSIRVRHLHLHLHPNPLSRTNINLTAYTWFPFSISELKLSTFKTTQPCLSQPWFRISLSETVRAIDDKTLEDPPQPQPLMIDSRMSRGLGPMPAQRQRVWALLGTSQANCMEDILTLLHGHGKQRDN